MKKIAFLFLIGLLVASCCKNPDVQYYPAELRNMLPYFPGQIIKFANENQDTVVFRCEYAQDELSESIKNQHLFCNKPKSRTMKFVVKFSRLDTLQNKVWTINDYYIEKFNPDWFIGIVGSDELYTITPEIIVRGMKFDNVYVRTARILTETDTVLLASDGIVAFTSNKSDTFFIKTN